MLSYMQNLEKIENLISEQEMNLSKIISLTMLGIDSQIEKTKLNKTINEMIDLFSEIMSKDVLMGEVAKDKIYLFLNNIATEFENLNIRKGELSMALQEISLILMDIQSNAGKLKKESIIKAHRENELFSKILNHIYNPYIKTNIAKKKLEKKVNIELAEEIKNFDEYLQYLQEKSTGTDVNIATIQKFIGKHKESEWLLSALAIKELKIGATAKTINKAYEKDFIPLFEIQLSEKWVDSKKVKGEKVDVENWKHFENKDVVITEKIDGIRCVIFAEEKDNRLFSREGNEFTGYEELESELSKLEKGYVYDGELLAVNTKGLNSNELFKETSRITKLKGEKKGLEYHIFDAIPIDCFVIQKEKEISTLERKAFVEKQIENMQPRLIKYVKPLYVGKFDLEIAENLGKEATGNGKEGIMVQLADSNYEYKRTKNILKIKSLESCDIRCVEVYEGKSESTTGKLGGIILDYKGFLINCGSGFSQQQRIDFWEDKNKIIGKIVEINYTEEFTDKDTGKLDLRFARFKGIREDKSEPSYY